jgi:hypothetical protein
VSRSILESSQIWVIPCRVIQMFPVRGVGVQALKKVSPRLRGDRQLWNQAMRRQYAQHENCVRDRSFQPLEKCSISSIFFCISSRLLSTSCSDSKAVESPSSSVDQVEARLQEGSHPGLTLQYRRFFRTMSFDEQHGRMVSALVSLYISGNASAVEMRRYVVPGGAVILLSER